MSDVLAHVAIAFDHAKGYRGDERREEVEEEAGQVGEAEDARYKAGETCGELKGESVWHPVDALEAEGILVRLDRLERSGHSGGNKGELYIPWRATTGPGHCAEPPEGRKGMSALSLSLLPPVAQLQAPVRLLGLGP